MTQICPNVKRLTIRTISFIKTRVQRRVLKGTHAERMSAFCYIYQFISSVWSDEYSFIYLYKNISGASAHSQTLFLDFGCDMSGALGQCRTQPHGIPAPIYRLGRSPSILPRRFYCGVIVTSTARTRDCDVLDVPGQFAAPSAVRATTIY